jgi:very-short-patch-repair endonuclease
VINLIPPDETAAAARTRAQKDTWLNEHDYKVLGIFASDVESNMAGTLDRIAAAIG